MSKKNCDFSPMKQKLIVEIQHLIAHLQSNVAKLDGEDYCLLNCLEEAKNQLVDIEAMAASFYLNCYLSTFTDTYEDLSASVQHLSKQRHGALIVVERSQSIDSIIQKGTPMEAVVTSKLLEAIFYPGNPLHDGAVVIRGNIVVSASNVLPLTKRKIGKEKVGTRHRAALGVTELSDALALVVSEETGKISFALEGNLYPINMFDSVAVDER
ncbi:sporulation-specific diadenylate cyclase CdaS [Bacillus sp. FJAT-49736]|uniref:sporulation-specific diadenylate cyclase CdaS n=1 Tax=Bacillus sp. FJAT-49736 TaxID=2833582 RepID=UPI001BC90E9E|nr:sporulation-specific diadenylate cyclase CdaS [Bacillus sp. FJAT-49736]MBS4175584.1 sporulation-specific diadenylate cyclase CdaS [Bacillus sp. FJAT-49736]